MRIPIADDYEAARRAIRMLLERRPGWEVCGEAADGPETVLKTESLRPDVVILDLALGADNGLTVAREIAAETPGLPIVLCTIFPTPVLEDEIGHCGIRAVVDKAKAGSELVDTVEKALADPPLRAFAAH